MSAGASLPRAYSVPQLRIILWCGNLIDEISHVFRRGLGRGCRRDARCNAPHAAIRDGGAAGRGGPSDADRIRVAVLRCPRPIGRRPVRMQHLRLRCSSPLLLGVVLCRPPATAPPDGALVLIGARGGVGAPGTTHQGTPAAAKAFFGKPPHA